jgi:hypothetical protein
MRATFSAISRSLQIAFPRADRQQLGLRPDPANECMRRRQKSRTSAVLLSIHAKAEETKQEEL